MFKKMNDPVTGLATDAYIIYTDPDGVVWTVPEGHRFWALYEEFLAGGGVPTPAD